MLCTKCWQNWIASFGQDPLRFGPEYWPPKLMLHNEMHCTHALFFLWLCVYSFLHIKVMKINLQRQFGPELWNCGTVVAAKINEQEIGSATNINALHSFYFSLSSILWLYVHSFSYRSNEDWSVILCCICADLFTGSSDYEERPPSLSFRSSSGRFVCRRIGQICRTICFNQALQMRHEVVVFTSFSQQL